MSINEIIAALRALAAEPPCAQVWEAICAQLDACAASGEQVAAEYVVAATDRWPARLDTRRIERAAPPTPEPFHGAELRRAPSSWVRAALAGQAPHKLAAARVLVHADARLTSAAAANLGACAALSGLRLLDVSGCALSGRALGALARSPHLAMLRALNLNGNPCGAGLGQLVSAPMMANLQALGLRETQLRAKSAPVLATLDAPCLAALQLERNALGGGVGAALVAARLPALERLYLGECGADDDDASALAAGRWPRLEALDARGNVMSPRGVAALTSMAAAPHLRALDLSHQGHQGRGGVAPGAMFQAAHLRLERVDVSGNAWLGRWAQALSTSAEQPALRAFRAERTRMRGHGLEALLRAPALRHVRALGLAHNMIFDDGARAIASAAHMGQLARLELADNPITPRGLAALLRSPHLTALEALTVGVPEVDFGDGYFKALLACAPHKPSLCSVCILGQRPSAEVLNTMIEAPELAHVRSVVFDLDPSAHPAGLVERVGRRFGRRAEVG